MTMTATTTPDDSRRDLRDRAYRLGLWGLLANWDQVGGAPWLQEVLHYEEVERRRRSLERRLRNAKLGRFKPMADFDWHWPTEIDRELVEELFTFGFADEAANVVLVGPNGVGKTMIAKNLAHQSILAGRTARFITASELLNDLAAQETSSALMRRLRHYTQPQLLLIDEVGYLATSSEHADLLFEVITRRYQEKSIVLTANRPFGEWSEVFPSSTCVVTLVDRLIHRAEIVKIDGESYRLKEAKEREAKREERRRAARKRRA
jgi:DNA replication protein DnaC